jgi:hypothetical protein
MLQPETVVMRACKPLESLFADGLLLCDLETGDVISLNATAHAIWEAMAEPITIAAICEALQQRFAVSEDQCLRDLATALAEFERRRFVRMRPAVEPSLPARAVNDGDALSI